MLIDLVAALSSDKPFKLAWKRVRHIRHGHNFTTSRLIESHVFPLHPHNDAKYVYAVHLRLCECGLYFHDSGLELRELWKK